MNNVVEHSTFKKQKYLNEHSEALTRIELMDRLERAREALSEAATEYTNAKVALDEHHRSLGIVIDEEDFG